MSRARWQPSLAKGHPGGGMGYFLDQIGVEDDAFEPGEAAAEPQNAPEAPTERLPASLAAARYARAFWLFGFVIDCGLLSGLCVRRFHGPLADMVICGSGPNLTHELWCSAGSPGSPDPDPFDHTPIQVIALSHSPRTGIGGGA